VAPLQAKLDALEGDDDDDEENPVMAAHAPRRPWSSRARGCGRRSRISRWPIPRSRSKRSRS
jgi:hypothetical protein